MTVFASAVLDNFNRADENPLSGGGNWSHNTGGMGGSSNYAAALRLVSNRALGQGSGQSYWTTSIGSAVETCATLAAFYSGSGVAAAELRLGPNPATNDGFACYWEMNNAGATGNVRIYVPAATASFTTSTLPRIPAAWALGDKFGIRAFPWDGTLAGTLVENWWYDSTRAQWVRLFGAFSANVYSPLYACAAIGSTALALDDFAAGSISAPGRSLGGDVLVSGPSFSSRALVGALRDRVADDVIGVAPPENIAGWISLG